MTIATAGRRKAVPVLLVTIAIMLSAGCLRGGADPPPSAPQGSVSGFRVSFEGVPDGEPPQDLAGGPATATANPNDDPGTHFRIADGRLTNAPSIDGRIASYYSSPNLGGQITDIGARWTFSPSRGSSGIMALLITQNLMVPPISVHLAITPQTWSFGVWPPGSGEDRLIELKTGSFATPLEEDGVQVYEAQVQVNGTSAVLHLPDGSFATVDDERIAEWAGPFAVFEAFANSGKSASRVAFTEIWASRRS